VAPAGARTKLEYVLAGRRSEMVLGALVCLVLANSVLAGLSLYALLAVALHLLGSHGPGIGWGLLGGMLIGIGLLALALREERMLREAEYGPWQFAGPNDPAVSQIATRVDGIRAASSLASPPLLWLLESREPNSFALGRSRDEAAVFLTTGLLDLLETDEEDAVIAYQLAQIELQNIRAVGLADAIVVYMQELARTRSRFFWGPRRMVEETAPFLGTALAIMVIVPIMAANNGGSAVAPGLISLGLLIALAWTAIRCWPGLIQIFLFIFFFGPLSLIEMALSAPTAIVLSRLVSRTRIFEADARALQLTGNPSAAIAALGKLARVERSSEEPWVGGPRFALYVAPRPQYGYRRWLARLGATHPTITERIEALRAAAQE
jgi:Zn-dependent protease with chaperone function